MEEEATEKKEKPQRGQGEGQRAAADKQRSGASQGMGVAKQIGDDCGGAGWARRHGEQAMHGGRHDMPTSMGSESLQNSNPKEGPKKVHRIKPVKARVWLMASPASRASSPTLILKLPKASMDLHLEEPGPTSYKPHQASHLLPPLLRITIAQTSWFLQQAIRKGHIDKQLVCSL